MSFQTLFYEVLLDKGKLLDLLLGEGDLHLQPGEQKPITIKEFSDHHILRKVNDITIHEVKIWGLSEDKNLSNVDGKATIIPSPDGETFTCKLELHLEDHFE